MPLYSADPDYYFRVDAHHGLRAMCEDQLFRPAHWQAGSSQWQHPALVNAAEGMPGSEAIYRISFWINEQEARKDVASRGWQKPHVMLRIPRHRVAEALRGWTFDQDEALPGQADLIWHRTANAGERFFEGGIAVEHFEVWEKGDWHPWPLAEAMQPDGVRMARIGWQPLALVTRQGGAVVAYWRMVLHHPAEASPQPWCLITLDERSRGTLGGETAAVQQAAELLLAGPLQPVAERLAGLLTVHVTQDRLWTEQYAVALQAPTPDSWLQRLLATRPVERQNPAWYVEPHTRLARAQELSLILASGLRQARPEARSYAWETRT